MLAGALLVFTVLKVLADLDHIFVFAGVGLVLALVIGYGGWQRWQEYAAIYPQRAERLRGVTAEIIRREKEQRAGMESE